MKNFVILMGLLLFTGPLYAQIDTTNLPRNERLDLVLENFCTETNIRGISASMNLGSENIWKGVHGISHDQVSIDTGTLFQYTQGPVLTSTIIMQLIEEGKLNLSDSIYKWLTAFNNVDSTITILQLLKGETSLPNYLINEDIISEMESNPEKTWTPEELLGYLGPPTGVPGSTGYNTGYILLGMIIEAVTGNSLASELESRIIIPCNLDRTFFLPDQSIREEVAHQWQYSEDNSSKYNTNSFYTLGWNIVGFVSTPEDNADFYKNLFYEKTLLNEYSIKMMQDSIFYIFNGQEHRYNDYATGYGETGRMGTGGASQKYYYPEDSLTFSICSNDSKYNPNVTPDIFKVLREKLPVAVRNLPPSDLLFPVDTLPGNLNINDVVGTFTAIDTNFHSTSDFTYSLVTGDGSNDKDNNCFEIAERELSLICELNPSEQCDYYIRVKSEDGYGGTITKSFVLYTEHCTVGAKDIKSFQQISYYPNPARDVLNIELDQTEFSEVSVALYDLTGRQVYSDYHNTTVGKNIMTIDVSNLAKGMYLLDIQQGNKEFLKKILIR